MILLLSKEQKYENDFIQLLNNIKNYKSYYCNIFDNGEEKITIDENIKNKWTESILWFDLFFYQWYVDFNQKIWKQLHIYKNHRGKGLAHVFMYLICQRL